MNRMNMVDIWRLGSNENYTSWIDKCIEFKRVIISGDYKKNWLIAYKDFLAYKDIKQKLLGFRIFLRGS